MMLLKNLCFNTHENHRGEGTFRFVPRKTIAKQKKKTQHTCDQKQLNIRRQIGWGREWTGRNTKLEDQQQGTRNVDQRYRPAMGQEMLVLIVVISNCVTDSRAYFCTFYKHMGLLFFFFKRSFAVVQCCSQEFFTFLSSENFDTNIEI